MFKGGSPGFEKRSRSKVCRELGASKTNAEQFPRQISEVSRYRAAEGDAAALAIFPKSKALSLGYKIPGHQRTVSPGTPALALTAANQKPQSRAWPCLHPTRPG